jgi:hypothetical protein
VTVVTYTRRQVVADLFPEFLTKRSQGVLAVAEAYAREVGIPRLALVYLSMAWQLRDGDAVRRDRFTWRSPYSTRQDVIDGHFRDLVAGGLAETAAGGWRITERGTAAVLESRRRVRARLREYDLPREATERAASSLRRVADRIPSDAERALTIKRLPHTDAGETPSAFVDLDRAVTELWNWRDDCHIAAWTAAGYDGPTVDVLTQAWSPPGDLTWATQSPRHTLDEVAKALEAKQGRAEAEQRVDALVRRGDLARDGDDVRITEQGQRARDGIEAETDRRFFAVWDLDDAATARLGDDLRAVIDALPKA